MRAYRIHQFGEPPAASVDDVPDPAAGRGQVVVRVGAAGINPVDVYVAAGKYATKPDLPYVAGNDAAGTVESVGEGVSDPKVGDRVIVCRTADGRMAGAFAERCRCEPAGLLRLPDRLSFAQGAAINIPYGTALRALLEVGKPETGDTVLIHGATGGVGLAALQIAKRRGLRVVATGGSGAGRTLLAEQGADVVLDHTKGDHLDALKDAPPDVILEMAADQNLARDIAAVAEGGRIVVIGNRGPTTIDARGLMMKGAAIAGMNYSMGDPSAKRRALDTLQADLDAGAYDPVIQAEVPLAEAGRAFTMVMAGGSHGKIAVVP